MAYTHSGYHAGHPWYYVLGGAVLSPSTIRNEVESSDYGGYLAHHIFELAEKSEPRRSSALNELRAQIVADLRADLSRYRKCVRKLREYRAHRTETEQKCEDIRVAICLKHNHIVNDLANLKTLDGLPKQGDLFDYG
jgi:hypothetical protein